MPENHSIPVSQRAFLLPECGGPAHLTNSYPVIQPSELQSGQCLVKLTFSGVCHSDLGIKNGNFPNKPKKDLIGGHEGIGTVVAIAANTPSNKLIKVGSRVGLKFLATACFNCDLCLKGFEGRKQCP